MRTNLQTTEATQLRLSLEGSRRRDHNRETITYSHDKCTCGAPASRDAVYVQQRLAIDTAVSSLISSWRTFHMHIHHVVGQCVVQLLTFRRKRSRNCDGKQGRAGGGNISRDAPKLAANSRFPSNIEHRLSAAAAGRMDALAR